MEPRHVAIARPRLDWRGLFVLTAALAMLAGCADEPNEIANDTADPGTDTTDPGSDTTPTQGDTSNRGDTTGTDTVVPAGDNVVEPTASDAEARDCLAGCTHDGPLYNFEWQTKDAYIGRIDGACHQRDNYPNGTGDVDIIGLKAAARTFLEITVEPTEGSPLDPVIETNSGNFIITYSNDRASGDKAARTTLAGPFINDLPFFVAIYDFQNYLAFDPTTPCDGYVGGDEYQYKLTVNEIPFVPVELGELQPGGSTNSSGTIAAPGDITYFTFTAPNTATPTVTITRTGSSEFILAGDGLNTVEGQLAFQGILEDGTSSLTLQTDDFRVCGADCDGSMAEWYFVVTDFNGLGASDFTFNVEVQL